MRTAIDPFISHLNAIGKELPKVCREIIRRNAIEIMDEVKYNQLSKGLDSQGQVIGTYAPQTEAIARRAGARKRKPYGEPYNFQWTGSTFDKMGIKFVGGNKFQVFTKDAKRDILREAYGEIFDLTEENNDWINEYILLPELQLYILNNLVVK